MSNRIAKVIRICTVPPLCALILLILLQIFQPQIYGSGLNFFMTIFTIVIFPLLGYPLQWLIPALRKQGRTLQRKLAFIMAGVGYIIGLFWGIFCSNSQLFLIFLTYLFSAILLSLVNLIHFKASGHLCGVAGAIALAIYFFKAPALWLLFLVPLVWWSSIVMKRHTHLQLLVGAFVPVVSLAMSYAIAIGF